MLLDLLVLIVRLHAVTVYLSATCYKKMQLETSPISLNGSAAMRKAYERMFDFYNDFIRRLHKGVMNRIETRHSIADQEKIMWLTSLLLQKGIRFKLNVWQENVEFSDVKYYGHYDLIYCLRKQGFTVVAWERGYGYKYLKPLP